MSTETQDKELVLGITHLKGNKDGNAYDMCRLLVARSIAPRNTKSGTFDGHGFEQKELNCDSTVIDQLNGKSFPQHGTVTWGLRDNRFGEKEPIVVGVLIENKQPLKVAS